MTKKYSNLFQFEIRHSFYENGLSRDFDIKPSPLTQQIMNKLDIRMRPEQSETKLFWGHQELNGEISGPLLSMDKPIVLTFGLQAKQPNFINYTQVDFPSSLDKKFYYPPVTEGTIELAGSTVAFNGMQQLVEFTPPPKGNPIEVSLQNVAGITVFTDTISEEVAQTGKYQLTLSSEEDWGQYKLIFNQGIKEQIIHALPDSLLPITWGVVQFIIPPASAVANTQGFKHQLMFTARETIWRYNIIDQSKSASYDKMVLLRNETADEGATTNPKTLTNGMEATVLTMSSPLPLQERSQEKIELELLQTQTDNTPAKSQLKIQLPTPDAQQIYPERDGDQLRIYSDIYVYM